MKLAAHQPNLFPWFPFFYKMHRADIFVVMVNCQFEKNGFQNRASIDGRWWTMPVKNGTEAIKDKVYINGAPLWSVNTSIILGLCGLLGIDIKKIRFDFPTESGKTERIIELCKKYGCDEYLTNVEAKDKYLDEAALNANGINIVPLELPNQHKRHLFEMFKDCGIEGTIRLLNKEFKGATVRTAEAVN